MTPIKYTPTPEPSKIDRKMRDRVLLAQTMEVIKRYEFPVGTSRSNTKPIV